MTDNRGQVESIKERVDIANIVQRYVNLKPAGKNLSGLCPFHNEKTPSFSVNQELQIFKCFGCGKGGDVFTFLQEIEKIDFPETLERLAKEAGITLEKSSGPDKNAYISEINEITQKFFTAQLTREKAAANYLTNRGINPELVKKFMIGYAPGGTSLLSHVRGFKKYTKTQILTCGLFVERDGEIKDKFNKRIMFPILSPRGKIIAFSGRLLPGNDFGPKYLNSPETPLFSKRLGVYGLYQARQSIRGKDLCVICEGQVDVISAHKAGIDNSVAPLGTAITLDQVSLISKMTKNILFIFDNDEAGQKALERAFVICSNIGINAYASSPAPYSDLDELIQKEPKLVSSVTKLDQDAFSFLLRSFIKEKDLKNFSEYTKTVSYIKKMLSSVKDSSIQSFYIKKVQEITGIQMDGQIGGLQSPIDPKEEASYEKKPLTTEHYYLKAISSQPLLTIPAGHNPEIFTDQLTRSIIEKIQEKESVSLRDLALILDESERKLLELIVMNPTSISTGDITNLYTRILKASIEKELKQASELLDKAEAEGNEEEVGKMEAIIHELTNKLNTTK